MDVHPKPDRIECHAHSRKGNGTSQVMMRCSLVLRSAAERFTMTEGWGDAKLCKSTQRSESVYLKMSKNQKVLQDKWETEYILLNNEGNKPQWLIIYIINLHKNIRITNSEATYLNVRFCAKYDLPSSEYKKLDFVNSYEELIIDIKT
ncbi:Protein of unknown function [Gryllus bimaculatus]|nr:Protein of unknown function [Gryllus bimaculatus]